MGSPVSVTVANLIMEDVEERAISMFHPSPTFCQQYVDDTCTAVSSDRVQDLLAHLNATEPSIQFMVEVESEGSPPFLDVHLHHETDGSISMTMYRKDTHTDQYLRFSLHHPLAHKLAVVKTLHYRAGFISSTEASCREEERHI